MTRTPKRLTLGAAIRRLAVYTLAGGIIGWLSGYSISTHDSGYLTLLLLFIAMPGLHFLMICRGVFVPILNGLAINYTTIVLSWIAYALVATSAAGRDSYYPSIETWIALGIIFLAIFLHLPAGITLVVWTLLDEGRIRSTNCLQCGYSLVGLRVKQCPECGKAFTLYEQGVSEEELSVDNPTSI